MKPITKKELMESIDKHIASLRSSINFEIQQFLDSHVNLSSAEPCAKDVEELQEVLETADLTHQPKPLAPEPTVNPIVPTPVKHISHIPATKDELLQRAQKNIGMLDREAGLQELDGVEGRVQVDEKALINSRADLNQLVPFKYSYAWQAYLKGSAHHWTAQEISMDRDVADWESANADETKLIQYAIYSLETNSSFKSNDPILSVYRWITNPEVRQYILRQRFELTIWGNFVHHVMDNFSYQFTQDEKGNSEFFRFNDKEYLSYLKREHVRIKQAHRHDLERIVGDCKFQPSDSFEDRSAIVTRLIMQYIVLGFIYNYTSVFQLCHVGLERKRFENLREGSNKILRDISLHVNMGLLLINGILEENPDLFTQENIDSWKGLILRHLDSEIDYLDWWANSTVNGVGSSEQIQTLQYLVNRFTVNIGLGTIERDISLSVPQAPSFVSLFDSYKEDLENGGNTVVSSDSNSGSGSSLEW